MSPMGFSDAVLTGLAPDGGLIIPDEIPNVVNELGDLAALDYVSLAKDLIARFVDDIPVADLSELIDRAYSSFDCEDVVAFKQLGELQVLELFHGPTLAFKDVALQLLGQLFEYILAKRGQHLNILGATSGDTGSAAIAGVRGQPNVDIFILYPDNRVSPLQELQMTTVVDDNVHCIAVDGSFDECQTIMKTAFAELAFKDQFSLGAVNSVNWARVLAQVVYYGYTALRFQESGPVSFCVPTGNFGNIFAGYVAKKMGFPIDKLILATNENDILSTFFNTGLYTRGHVHYTVSPAMDIQVASNFERFLYFHTGEDAQALSAIMAKFSKEGSVVVGQPPAEVGFLATSVNESDTLDAIKSVYEQHQYILDPHTAVGVVAAQRYGHITNLICIGTAHPAKFPESVNRSLGAELATHPSLEVLKDQPTRSTKLPAQLQAVKDYVAQHASV